MKNLRFLAIALTVLALAIWVEAATAPETYSTTISNQATLNALDWGRIQHNTDTCAKGSLPSTCTQAEICVALNVTGGAACTLVDALAAGARLYSNTLGGRQSFVGDQLIRKAAEEFKAEQRRREILAAMAACAGYNETQKNVVCSAYGLPNGCTICD